MRSGRAGAVAAVCCMCLVWSTSPAPRESAVEGQFAFSEQVQGLTRDQIQFHPRDVTPFRYIANFALCLVSRV